MLKLSVSSASLLLSSKVKLEHPNMLRLAVVALTLVAASASPSYSVECPKGYELHGKDSCVKYEHTDAQTVCPKGYEHHGKNECKKSFEIQKEFTTEFETEKCEAEYFCPKGSEKHGKECIKKIAVSPKVQMKTDKHECKVEEFCPKGYTDNKHECVKEMIVSEQVVKKEKVHSLLPQCVQCES